MPEVDARLLVGDEVSIDLREDAAAAAHGLPCRVYLIRHGRTSFNTEGRYRGRRDIPLDEQGFRDARSAAECLSGAGLGAVYAAPLERVRDTAVAVGRMARLPVIDLPDLINLDYGEWEGLTKAEVARLYPEAYRIYREYPETATIPGGESLAEAGERIKRALVLLGRRHPGGAVAAASHGIMIRLAVALAAGLWGRSFYSFQLQPGSVTPLDVRGERFDLAQALEERLTSA
jgi:broad specificity phosphatase PhoE